MFFEKEKIGKVKEFVENRAKNANLNIKISTDFLQALESINQETTYREGQLLSQEHQNTLRAIVRNAIDDHAAEIISNANEKDYTIDNPMEYYAIISDYYFVIALEKLGCPNIPLFINNDIKETVDNAARRTHQAISKYNNISTDETFKNQRYKNAKEVDKIYSRHRSNLRKHKDGITLFAKDVGELLAEYQALKERQSNHGKIWRFFHRKENDKRTELLNQMKATVKSLIPKRLNDADINIDTIQPSELAQKLADHYLLESYNKLVSDRFYDKTANIFGSKPADSDLYNSNASIINSNDNSKIAMKNENNFANDIINDSINELASPVNNPPSHNSAEIKKG